MNSLVRDLLPAVYFAEYQGLRRELTDILSDADLAFRPGPGALTLGELCREMGEVEHAYIEAFRTFRLAFGWRNPEPAPEGDLASLVAWYATLDAELQAALEALSEDDIGGRR